MLRINEAAKLLGVSPSTLRRWEREGLIKPQRTPGGERRYREEDLMDLSQRPRRRPGARYDDVEPVSEGITEAVGEARNSHTSSREYREPAHVQTPPWEARVHEAKANLEIQKVLREQQRLRREDVARLEAVEERAQRRKEQAKVAETTAKRLNAIKVYGQTVAVLESPPLELRAKITKDLEAYVTAEQFPSSLPLATAYEYVRSRVEKLLGSWKSERAASEARDKLFSYGRHQARLYTSNWDSTEASRAVSELERAFRKEEVTGWTRDDMRDYVETFLDAF